MLVTSIVSSNQQWQALQRLTLLHQRSLRTAHLELITHDRQFQSADISASAFRLPTASLFSQGRWCYANLIDFRTIR